jgi:L-fucose isomerase and related proteins
MTMVPKIALVGLAGEYEIGFSETLILVANVEENLKSKGYEIIRTDKVMYDGKTAAAAVEQLKGHDFDIICVCVGTWSEDHHLLDLLDYYDKPIVLWAFPAIETGSLCGVQQICCVLKELGKRYYFVYGEPGNTETAMEVGVAARAEALVNKMKHVKIGTIGGRIKGMTEIAFDEFEIKEKTGVRIINLDEDELIKEYFSVPDDKAAGCWEGIKPEAGKITSTEEHGIEAAKYYMAMKGLVNDYELEGLCIKCYPRFMGKVCLGYSMLSEEGIVCGCEGDINNTVSMKILYELTGIPTHNTDLLFGDEKLNTILFSHCGSGGFSIADRKENIHFAPVRLADSGVCSLFPAKPGKVTLINLVGRKGTYRMSAIVGEAVECGMEFPGNPLKVRFERKIIDINRQIATEGIGHHWIGGYGDVSRELKYFCDVKGIRFIML